LNEPEPTYSRKSYHLPPLQKEISFQIKPKYEQEKRLRPNTGEERQEIFELQSIKSVQDLEIDYSEAMAVKKGDLAIIQGEVFRCKPLSPPISHHRLVLKHLECVDRRIYDLKVYEFDQFMRFSVNPHVTPLYSYWGE
jgi:hypothetical protein